MKKVVLLKIVVPDDDKCFNKWTTCHWFDNKGDNPICRLSLGTLTRQNNGSVLKPDRCKDLPDD